MDDTQLELDREKEGATGDGASGGAGVGKSSLTSRLTPAPQYVFRVSDPETARALGESLSSGSRPSRPRILREAARGAGPRDSNGVASGAEAAVDRAASSSGSPLPGHIQRQFEGSLGADLSGVRVHTGSESAQAAEAVGAKAYTVGNDIHFAEGRYQPQDPFGMHLLAHEVAHTVQQSGGSPRRQHKLEVSTPQDAAEHEADRAADAMVRGESVGAAGAGIWRTPAHVARDSCDQQTKTPSKMDQLFPPDKKCEQVNNEPFGPNNLPPAARKILQDLTLDSLRSLANDHVNHAYTNYLAACLEVKGKVQKKKDEREAKEKATIELALGAVGMCLGPVATAVGAKIAGPAIQSFVKSQIEEKLPGKLTALLAADAKLATAMAGDAYKIVASDAVTSLAARFTPEAASGLLGSAGAAAGKAMFKVDLNGGPEDRTIAYVDALMEQTDQTHKALLTAIGTSTNEDALMGAYSKFSSVTLKQYRAEIEQTANHFLTQIAPTAGPGHKQQIVSVNAYGRARLASAIFSNPGDALFGEIKPWIFKSWVTPDMEKTARSMNSNIQTVKPTAFSNHIPDPGIEGEISGEEHIVQMDAWGKMRLAIIKSDVSIWSGPSGKVVFVRWVQADDEETTRIKGSTQVAGIPTIDPSRCEGGIAKPADA